ncbi:MAG: UDP-glucose/GDP-mannose dehydrogenase family protein [Leucobacter sp.]|nr:UDP-glucose/GDP-mannose dehydrogenase family protein [Leucobacter sp.]
MIGCGYLGAVHAAAMASLGHRVIGIDTSTDRVAQLATGVSPFFEPGLDDLLRTGIDNGRLSFSADIADAAAAEVHFICVGTPQVKDGSAADLSFVDAAVASLLPHLQAGAVVAGKSTVPVGTAARLAPLVREAGAELAWNPEFLREGWAVKDTLEPDRLVIGVASDSAGQRAEAVLREVYRTPLEVGTPCIVADYATAELVKVSANAFLATKISFINAMAEIAEVTGADVTVLADAIGHDDRIGRRFLGAGIGFGGGCLPKDIRAFAARAEELGLRDSVGVLRDVDAINLRRREHAVQLVVDELGGSPLGKRVAVLGAAFKPHSDDTRDSPALFAATRLHGLGADVVVTDPRAIDDARNVHPQLAYEADLDTALRDAEVVLLVTEWPEYRYDLDPAHAAKLVARPVIVDARNALNRDAWRAAGWRVRGMGRP